MSVATRPSTNEDHSDEELMSQLAAGRREALGLLHDRYAALISGLAARSLDRAAAEEISQEVFLAVWRYAATFDPARGSFRAWVMQIARTRVVNELRRRSRMPRATSQSQDPDADNLADSGPSPAEAAWREHRRAALRRQERALSLITNSDVVSRRLGAAPGTGAAAHGHYSGRPGVDLAVLTLSHLAPAPDGYEYRAWVSHGGRWTWLGRVQLDTEGRSLIIAEAPELIAPPDQLQVTLEPIIRRAGAGNAPTGPPVILWPTP
jgi:RNA polymerase sigma factor (sigma-70 family)